MKKQHKKYSPNFEKLQIKYQSKIRNEWVGDWDLKTNKIMVYKNLKDIDKVGVIVHEFIEMIITMMFGIPDCCQEEYDQDKHGKLNKRAHDIANKIERMILRFGGYSWRTHERRINRIRG